MWTVDARIPLVVVTDLVAMAAALRVGTPAALLAETPPPPLPADAVAVVGFDPFLPHGIACACCNGRSSVATALDRLFQARVRGRCAWFDRVIALAETPEAQLLVAAALREDAVTAARFRPA